MMQLGKDGQTWNKTRWMNWVQSSQTTSTIKLLRSTPAQRVTISRQRFECPRCYAIMAAKLAKGHKAQCKGGK